ncbi:penicillin acylase family protein [Candidatus Hydrogenedentota bacterium]
MFRRHCVIISLFIAVSGICYLGSDEAAGYEIKIIRDTWGIPYISSPTDVGAMFGLGYACAEDRMFQMEYSRRVIQGRLAEMVGNLKHPTNNKWVLESDQLNRAFQYYPHAQVVAENLDVETRRFLLAYADGVNQYLEDNESNLHYLFGVYGITPEPWTPADSIACWEHIGQFFSPESWKRKAKTLHDFEDLVTGGMSEEEAVAALTSQQVVDEAAAVVQESEFDPVARAELDAYAAAHGYGPGLLHGLDYDWEHFSHAWVVGGSRTTTGASVLNSDPQTTVRNPAVWHEAHIKGATFDSRGVHFPGSPGILIGWNRNVAWGVTALGGDINDVFRLDMKPGDPAKYIYDGEERGLEIWNETINIRGGSPVTVTLKCAHIGPIVTEHLSPGNAYPGEEYVLKNPYLAFSDRHTLQAIFRMMRAGDVFEFGEASDGYLSPGCHMLFGDDQGNIGYWTQVGMPLRSRLSAMGAKAAQYGTGAAYDWEDIIPHSIMPHVINPPNGAIFSANHLPVGTWYPLPLIIMTGGTGDGQRSWRLRELLSGDEIFEPEDLIDIHLDDVNPAMRTILRIGYHVRSNGGSFSAAAENLMDTLRGWYANGAHCDTEEPYYAGAHNIDRYFRLSAAGPLWYIYGGGDGGLCFFLKTLQAKINADSAYVLDSDEHTYIQRALENGWNRTVSKFGSNPDDWQAGFNDTEGRLLVAYMKNLEGFPSLDPSLDFLSNVLSDPNGATVWAQKGNSYSQWVNLADVNGSKAVLPVGISENPESPHYRAEEALWESGNLRHSPLDLADIEATSTTFLDYNHLWLMPVTSWPIVLLLLLAGPCVLMLRRRKRTLG